MDNILIENFQALLLCGSDPLGLKKFCYELIKWQFCKNNQARDCQCLCCLALEKKEEGYKVGQNFLWLNPVGLYDVKTIDQMLSKICFSLGAEERFFVVLESVDRMPKACSNRILKTLEEPATGYKFILTAQNQSSVIPTILSRCQIFQVEAGSLDQIPQDQISKVLLSGPGVEQAQEFFDLIESLDPDQMRSHEIFEFIFSSAARELFEINSGADFEKVADRKLFLEKLLDLCRILQKMPVCPGSGKIFWKNFFVQLVLS